MDQAGAGTRITFTDGTPWVQVCTSDWPGPSHRAAVAIEPMTCPPDALRSGTGLVVLEPGAQHQTWWRLEAVRLSAIGPAGSPVYRAGLNA